METTFAPMTVSDEKVIEKWPNQGSECERGYYPIHCA